MHRHRFETLQHASRVIADWIGFYNHRRPHQVLAMKRMPAWRVFLWVKATEVICQVRPRALMRLIWRPDAKIRHATRWYYRMGRRVWFHEIIGFFLRDRRVADGRTVAQHFGGVQDHEEEASSVPPRPRKAA